MKIGIIGLGIVGNAIYQSFKRKKIEHILVYDKYKNNGIGKIKNLIECDYIFMCLPTQFSIKEKKYDLSAIIECCNFLDKKCSSTIIIKSTILPYTTRILAKLFKNLSFIHNPEFLTSRTALYDFHYQKYIVIGSHFECSKKRLNNLILFYKKFYPKAKIKNCKSIESETMKILCNSFYAIKVQIFTEFYLLCKKLNINYNIIRNLILEKKFVNPNHTKVPGPDGLISYGGMCFSKDSNAVNELMKFLKTPNMILDSCIKERNNIRNDNDGIIN